MSKPTEAAQLELDPKERILIALDVSTASAALELVGRLKGQVGGFKVGLQLYSAAGPEFVRELTSAGLRVFLDLKFHDIPNTVANACIEAARLGVWMTNVHASGGREMMERAVDSTREFCLREGLRRPLMIGVTVLTSSDSICLEQTGVPSTVDEQVERLARLSAESGLDGVVASPREVSLIKKAIRSKDFIAVTPGIRPKTATHDDQRRVTTFGEAVRNGSDFIVIGRPITQAAHPVEAVENILSEVV